MNSLHLDTAPNKPDILSSTQIRLLVDSFYTKVRRDPLLASIFEEHIHDWEAHLPTMYQFWESLLFGTGTYQGNPLQKHLSLVVQRVHFETWVELFTKTVDEHFRGENAQRIKKLASNIAATFQSRMSIKPETIHDALPQYSRASVNTGIY